MTKHPPIGTVPPPEAPRLTRLDRLREQLADRAQRVELEREQMKRCYRKGTDAFCTTAQQSSAPVPEAQASGPAEAVAPEQWHSEAPPAAGVYWSLGAHHMTARARWFDGQMWHMDASSKTPTMAEIRSTPTRLGPVAWSHCIEADTQQSSAPVPEAQASGPAEAVAPERVVAPDRDDDAFADYSGPDKPEQWHSEAPPVPGVYAAEALPIWRAPGELVRHWNGIAWSEPFPGRCTDVATRARVSHHCPRSRICWHHLIEPDAPAVQSKPPPLWLRGDQVPESERTGVWFFKTDRGFVGFASVLYSFRVFERPAYLRAAPGVKAGDAFDASLYAEVK